MGVLDSVKGLFGDADPGKLVDQAKGLFAEDGPLGGVNGMLDKLRESGLGKQVDSWISKDDNQPVTGEEVKSAFGSEQLKAIADKAGTTVDKVSSAIAGFLPQAIDKLTPDGKLPDMKDMKDRISKLF
jgi:uncharacterized protein YidB (DUF937 family)